MSRRSILESFWQLCPAIGKLRFPIRTICFGEVGLSGEVRAVNMAKQRYRRQRNLEFETCILPKVSLTDEVRTDGIQLIGSDSNRAGSDFTYFRVIYW